MRVNPVRAGTRLSRWKKALFSALATTGFFVLLEILLALGGVAPGLSAPDPFIGFASTVPLFVEDDGADGRGYMVTAANKLGWFNQQRFMSAHVLLLSCIEKTIGNDTHKLMGGMAKRSAAMLLRNDY